MNFDLQNFYKSIQQAEEMLSKAINELKNNLPDFTNIININFNDGTMVKNIKEIHKKLLINGWYISQDTNLNILASIEDEEDINKINEVMAEASKCLVDKTYTRIKLYYPNRYNIIRDALNAHNNKLYTLSIPIIISQSDGICMELFGVNLYSKDEKHNYKVPKTKYARKDIQESSAVMEAMALYPLDILTGFNFGTEKKHNIKSFNRNSILHGSNLVYDSEINSLKCISLLNYLLDIKEEYFDKQ